MIEFQPGVNLDPAELKLRGNSPDRWELRFKDLPTRDLSNLGEGDLSGGSSWSPSISIQPNRVPVDPSGLPTVAINRYSVVIDPGHGGPDPGAIGIRGLRETEVVLDVSLQVADLLRARGVKVHLTRTREVDVDAPTGSPQPFRSQCLHQHPCQCLEHEPA